MNKFANIRKHDPILILATYTNMWFNRVKKNIMKINKLLVCGLALLPFCFGCTELPVKIGVMVIQIGATPWVKEQCRYTGPGSTNQQSSVTSVSATNAPQSK